MFVVRVEASEAAEKTFQALADIKPWLKDRQGRVYVLDNGQEVVKGSVEEVIEFLVLEQDFEQELVQRDRSAE